MPHSRKLLIATVFRQYVDTLSGMLLIATVFRPYADTLSGMLLIATVFRPWRREGQNCKPALANMMVAKAGIFFGPSPTTV